MERPYKKLYELRYDPIRERLEISFDDKAFYITKEMFGDANPFALNRLIDDYMGNQNIKKD